MQQLGDLPPTPGTRVTAICKGHAVAGWSDRVVPWEPWAFMFTDRVHVGDLLTGNFELALVCRSQDMGISWVYGHGKIISLALEAAAALTEKPYA